MKIRFLLVNSNGMNNVNMRVYTTSALARSTMQEEYTKVCDGGRKKQMNRAYNSAYVKNDTDYDCWQVFEMNIQGMKYALLSTSNTSTMINVAVYENADEARYALQLQYKKKFCEDKTSITESYCAIDAAIINQKDGKTYYWEIKSIPKQENARSVVEQYVRTHPYAKQTDCVSATGLSNGTVCRYWPKNTLWGRAYEMVEEFCKNNPRGTQNDCVKATGLSATAVSMQWRNTEAYKTMRKEIEAFYIDNPQSTYLDCQRMTGYKRSYVKKFWPGNITVPKRLSIKKTSIVILTIAGKEKQYVPFKTDGQWDLKADNQFYGLSCRTLKELSNDLYSDCREGLVEKAIIAC